MNIDTPSPATSNTTVVSAAPVVITLEYVQALKDVLQRVKVRVRGGGGASSSLSVVAAEHLAETSGLTRTRCKAKGQCAWVCASSTSTTACSDGSTDGLHGTCQQRFEAQGNDCVGLHMEMK